MSLNYQDMVLPVYRNTAEVITFNAEQAGKLRRVTLTLTDLVLAAELAGLNMLFISDTGRGKTQLVRDIYNAHFGGNGNLAEGRKDFSILDLFERQTADLSQGKFDSETARTLHTERIGYPINIIDELNLAPGPVQADFFNLATGSYTFRGKPIKLGREGYALFLATMNLNKSGDNGFSGTFEVNRALYNRAQLTIDLDHKAFRPTPEDKCYIHAHELNPGVKDVAQKDLSNEILEAWKTIHELAKKGGIDKQIFSFLIDDGLHYCQKDSLQQDKEGLWPMACLDCPHHDKICSAVKASSERTVQGVALLAQALDYVARLKYGELSIASYDALLEAFRFTSYHGNLNDHFISERFNGRRQLLMDQTVSKLRGILQTITPFISEGRVFQRMIELKRTDKEGIMRTEYNPQLEKELKVRKIVYTIHDLEDTLKDLGIGADWIQSLRP